MLAICRLMSLISDCRAMLAEYKADAATTVNAIYALAQAPDALLRYRPDTVDAPDAECPTTVGVPGGAGGTAGPEEEAEADAAGSREIRESLVGLPLELEPPGDSRALLGPCEPGVTLRV